MIKKRIRLVILFFSLGLIFFQVFFPFYWAINTSLKHENQLMMMPTTIVPKDPQTGKLSLYWGNYLAVFENPVFLKSIGNSAVVALSVTLLSLVFGSLAAFALAKLQFRGKQWSLYFILTMTMFPQISVLSSLYVMARILQMHPVISMILSYLLFTLPFTVWVMTGYYRHIPSSLLEAAYVDGATAFQSFVWILLPLTIPGAVTTGLLAFIAAWNEYLFALTFTLVEPSSRTIPVAIALFSGKVSLQQPHGEVMAASMVITIPLLILVVVFQKKLIEGLTAGAIKG